MTRGSDDTAGVRISVVCRNCGLWWEPHFTECATLCTSEQAQHGNAQNLSLHEMQSRYYRALVLPCDYILGALIVHEFTRSLIQWGPQRM
jgi:hypothetical protein